MDYLGRFISFLGVLALFGPSAVLAQVTGLSYEPRLGNCVYLRKDHSDGCGELPLDLCLVWGFDVRRSDSASPFSRSRVSHL